MRNRRASPGSVNPNHVSPARDEIVRPSRSRIVTNSSLHRATAGKLPLTSSFRHAAAGSTAGAGLPFPRAAGIGYDSWTCRRCTRFRRARPPGQGAGPSSGRWGPPTLMIVQDRAELMDTASPRRSSSRVRRAWSAATPSRRPCGAAIASGPWSAPTSDTRWLDAWGVEKVVGDLEDAEALRPGVAGADWVFNCAAKVGDWGTLEEFRRLNVEALRLLLDAAAEARVERFVHVSSLGVYEGRDHHGTDETVPPAANSLDAYTRSKTEAEALVLRYHRRARAAGRGRPARLHLRRARPHRPAQAADEPAPGHVRLLRLGRAGPQLHLREEPGPRHLPRRREPGGRRRGLQPDRRRAREQDAVRRPGRRAGGPAGPRRGTSPWAWPGSSPTSSRGSPSFAGAKNPPLINKARYKFLGLNLDYSIDKARRVLGYQPPFSFDEAIERAMAEHRPRELGAEPTTAASRATELSISQTDLADQTDLTIQADRRGETR